MIWTALPLRLTGWTEGSCRSAQVHTLLKGLEKIAASADIPMLVAGDFNSVPGSAAHDLLTRQSVSPDHKARFSLLASCMATHAARKLTRTEDWQQRMFDNQPVACVLLSCPRVS